MHVSSSIFDLAIDFVGEGQRGTEQPRIADIFDAHGESLDRQPDAVFGKIRKYSEHSVTLASTTYVKQYRSHNNG